ncbi:c-type cytochrome [Piscinibacter aquaticus]|uniref:C-type cytochrome n=1 Tax=Piscinibacter aquaticus TaxID=392597 RepID=A0A5C6U0I2_9BURK|nr:c-type cytochrome [Piscinibacter aquaticus]
MHGRVLRADRCDARGNANRVPRGRRMARKLQPAVDTDATTTGAPPMNLLFAPACAFALRCVAACVLALPLWAGAAAPPKDAPRGAVLYHNYCSVCHGDKGNGQSRATGSLSTPPRDFTSEASRAELSRERIVLAITHGRPGTAMVGWKTQLSDADIGVLADHVLATFVNREAGSGAAGTATAGISGTRAHGGREADTASTPVQVDMTAGLPNGLKGDFKRGGAFISPTAPPATARAATAPGRAPTSSTRSRATSSSRPRARFNRVALYAAVSEGRLGSEMPAWKQVATPQQMADVSEYVFRSFIVAAPAAQAAAK